MSERKRLENRPKFARVELPPTTKSEKPHVFPTLSSVV
jgi:hypothetical protein